MRAGDLTIRYASADDQLAIAHLAAVDSARVPPGPLLLGEVDGELWAAVALTTGVAIADPFRPSGEVVALLRARSAQLAVDPAPRSSRWPTLVRAPQAVASMFSRT